MKQLFLWGMEWPVHISLHCCHFQYLVYDTITRVSSIFRKVVLQLYSAWKPGHRASQTYSLGMGSVTCFPEENIVKPTTHTKCQVNKESDSIISSLYPACYRTFVCLATAFPFWSN